MTKKKTKLYEVRVVSTLTELYEVQASSEAEARALWHDEEPMFSEAENTKVVSVDFVADVRLADIYSPEPEPVSDWD